MHKILYRDSSSLCVQFAYVVYIRMSSGWAYQPPGSASGILVHNYYNTHTHWKLRLSGVTMDLQQVRVCKMLYLTCQPLAEDSLDIMTTFPGFNFPGYRDLRPLTVFWRLTKYTNLRSLYTIWICKFFNHALLYNQFRCVYSTWVVHIYYFWL